MRVSLDTLIERSVRNMGTGIHPVVKESALELIRKAYKEGINVQISSGFRSFAEQNALYAQGRTKPGNIVTNAKAGQSNHNYGLAIDYFLLTDDGKAIWNVTKEWKRVAAIGKSLGFAWGGDWKSFPDYPHLEMMGGLTLRQLQEGKRPALVSKFPEVPVTKAEVEEKRVVVERDDWLMEPIKFDSSEINNAVARVLGRFEKKDPALGKEWRKSFLDETMKGKDLLGLVFVAIDRSYITGLTEENVAMIVQEVIKELEKGE